MSPPTILAGTGGLGSRIQAPEFTEQILYLRKAIGLSRIDTAARYPGEPHKAEAIIGETGFSTEDFDIDTKVLYIGPAGALTKDHIASSVKESLSKLKISKVRTLYAHGPDHKTPLEETAAAFDELYRQGKFTQLGLCNFSLDMFKDFYAICEKNNYVKPKVYQGQYNLLCRNYEQSLVPFLREKNVSFVAFSPLAGGVLTGKLTFAANPDVDLKGTRFDTSPENKIGAFGRGWYDHECFHDAMRKMKVACDADGVDTTDAAMRWLMHHSILDGEKGDGIIIGPRTMEQSEKYAQGIKDGHLPARLVEELNKLFGGAGVKEQAAKILVY